MRGVLSVGVVSAVVLGIAGQVVVTRTADAAREGVAASDAALAGAQDTTVALAEVTGVVAEISTGLDAGLDTIGAVGDSVASLAERIATLSGQLAQIGIVSGPLGQAQQRLDDAGARLRESTGAVAGLDETLAEASAALAGVPLAVAESRQHLAQARDAIESQLPWTRLVFALMAVVTVAMCVGAWVVTDGFDALRDEHARTA